MSDLKFFDVNVTMGRPSIPKYRVCEDVGEMREDLARFSITGGLVRDTLQLEVHPSHGNERVAGRVASTPGFEPVWAVMPHWTGEFPEGPVVVQEMRAAGARVALCYPKSHGYSLRESVSGALFDSLEVASAPLLIPLAESSFDAIEAVAQSHPLLPIILTDTSYGLLRELYALLDSCANVYVETSSYMVHRGIEDFCRSFGAERMLFGSKYPTYNPGCAVSALMYAKIRESERALVAHGNAERLLMEASS